MLAWLPSRRSDAVGQDLLIAPDALRLGEVWAQKDYPVALPLRNVSDRELEIVHLGCSPCGCCKFEPATVVIPSGEERQIQARLDLTARNEKESQLPERDYRVNITVALRGETGPPRTWQLSGNVRSVLTISPVRLDFARTLVQGSPPPTLVAAIRAHVALVDLRIECDPSMLTACLERDAHDARRYRLTVQPLGLLCEGPFESAVILKPIRADRPGEGAGSGPPPIAYQVRGEVLADVQPVPSSVSFGLREVGATADHLVTLHSHSGQPFEVTGFHSSSPNLRVLAADTAIDKPGVKNVPTASYGFRLQPTFTQSGPFAADVEFAIRIRDQPAKVVLPVFAHVSSAP